MIIFEPPQSLGGSGLPIWLGISGGPNWGGADIWVSEDNASYQKYRPRYPGGAVGEAGGGVAGRQRARPDQHAGRRSDAEQRQAGERRYQRRGGPDDAGLCRRRAISLRHGDAGRRPANTISPTSSVGAYGTAIAAHPAGAPFLRLDGAVVRIYHRPRR